MEKKQVSFSLPLCYEEIFDHLRNNVPRFAGDSNGKIVQVIIKEQLSKMGLDLCSLLNKVSDPSVVYVEEITRKQLKALNTAEKKS